MNRTGLSRQCERALRSGEALPTHQDNPRRDEPPPSHQFQYQRQGMVNRMTTGDDQAVVFPDRLDLFGGPPGPIRRQLQKPGNRAF